MQSRTRLRAKAELKGAKTLKSTRSLKSKSSIKTGVKSSKGQKLSGRAVSSSKSKKPVVKNVSKLKKLADKYFSLATRYRFADEVGGEFVAKCVTCGIKKPIKMLQCGHFMSRKHNITRYDERNCAPQCYGCNVMHQGRQYEFGLAIDKMYGVGVADELYQLSKKAHQFTKEELVDIIHDSREQILFYESH